MKKNLSTTIFIHTTLHKYSEQNALVNLVTNYIETYAQANISEYFNIKSHTKQRSKIKCKSFLKSNNKKDFEFLICLN